MNAPSVIRTKTMELTRLGPDRYHLSARLTDTSHHGDYGSAHVPTDGADRAVIHDFLVTGELGGRDLVISALSVTAGSHPYRECPAMLPSCQSLVGRSIVKGWRSVVLEMLGSTAGCTHITTLLIGLAEARTMAIFLQMNQDVEYSPQARGDGSWTAHAIAVAPGVVGACHALVDGGPVIAKAERGRGGDAGQ